ncbi:DUF3560 domain-containing protein [Streptomyces althioticus]|uniref:DUF3560 domain-containing protein n=1 Tax=Streptomyces althioticus TaxID=83380 RepID=UPI0033F5996D
MSTQEETPAQRAQRLRADANTKRARADEAKERAEAASKRASGMYERFSGGQSLLVGHHSYKSARRDRDRADNATRRALELAREAERLDVMARRAEAKAEMAEKVAARTTEWGPQHFRKGDVVTYRVFESLETTCRVKRVNKKSLTLDGGGGGMDDPRPPYARILARYRDGVRITDPSQAEEAQS